MGTSRTNSTSFLQRLRRGPWPEGIAQRLASALDSLAHTLRDTEGVEALVLFGSYARGDFGRKSDVDLLVVLSVSNRSLQELRSSVIAAAIKAETDYHLPMHIAPLVVASPAIAELGADLREAIAADGVVLFAEASALNSLQPDGLAPWRIVRFSATGLLPSEAVRLSRRLHGRGGRPGLLALPTVELARGALFAPAQRANVICDVLDELGASYDVIPVWRQV